MICSLPPVEKDLARKNAEELNKAVREMNEQSGTKTAEFLDVDIVAQFVEPDDIHYNFVEIGIMAKTVVNSYQ